MAVKTSGEQDKYLLFECKICLLWAIISKTGWTGSEIPFPQHLLDVGIGVAASGNFSYFWNQQPVEQQGSVCVSLEHCEPLFPFVWFITSSFSRLVLLNHTFA